MSIEEKLYQHFGEWYETGAELPCDASAFATLVDDIDVRLRDGEIDLATHRRATSRLLWLHWTTTPFGSMAGPDMVVFKTNGRASVWDGIEVLVVTGEQYIAIDAWMDADDWDNQERFGVWLSTFGTRDTVVGLTLDIVGCESMVDERMREIASSGRSVASLFR